MNDTNASGPDSSSWRIKRNAARAVLAGAWAALCLSLPRLGYALLDEPMRKDSLDLMDMPGLALARHLPPLGLPPWLTLALTAFVAISILAFVWLLVLRWLDDDKDAGKALRWSVRTLPMLLLWSVGLAVALGAAMLMAEHLPSDYAWGAMLAPLAYFLSLPFFCLRREIIGLASPPLAWRPGWPGGPAFGTAVASGLLVVAAAHGEAALASKAVALAWPASVAGWLLRSVALTAVLLVWLRRSRWPRLLQDIQDALRWRPLRRVLAVQWLSYGLLTLVLAPPLLAIALDAIFFQPTIAAVFEMRQLPRPAALTAWFGIADWVVQYWWLCLGLPILWLELTACARALLKVDDATAS